MQFELLQESADVTTVLQHVQQAKLFRVTIFYADNLPLGEGNNCFEFIKRYGFVHEQQFALQKDWIEKAMYETLFHNAMKHDEPVEGNAKDKTQQP